MALVHNMSKECVKLELYPFLVPLTEQVLRKNIYVEIPPLTAISDSAPLEFFISVSNKDYLDLNNTYLYMRVKITKAKSENLGQEDEVGFINYPGCKIVVYNTISRHFTGGQTYNTFLKHLSLLMYYRVSFELWKGYSEDTIWIRTVLHGYCRTYG